MAISKYNDQTILTFVNSEPATDEYAKSRKNSLRQIDEKNDIQKMYECREFCLYNDECVHYDYDEKKQNCKLYRKEPFREINDLSLKDCTEFCSKDDKCDYISHSVKNKCELYTREDYIGKSVIEDLYFDFPIYGYNTEHGKRVTSFDECKKTFPGKSAVYYKDYNYCIPRKFTKDNIIGNTTIFFNKTPLNKYSAINSLIGLKSKNRDKVDKYKYFVLVIFFIIIFIIFYKFTKLFD